MGILLFEDELAPQMYPISTGRPLFAVTCAGYRLIDHVQALKAEFAWVVRPHLRAVAAADFQQQHGHDYAAHAQKVFGHAGLRLLVNAAAAPSIHVRTELDRLLSQGRPGVVRTGTRVAAAILPEGQPLPRHEVACEEFVRWLYQLDLLPLAAEIPLFEYPHDVVRYHLKHVKENLEFRAAESGYSQVDEGVFVGAGVSLGRHVVWDTTAGPVIIEDGAQIGPYCLLRGPALIGAKSRVIEHAAIKDGAVLGHTTKIGGEIEASIIEPYTNKQHYGFLGHSYLGSWVNMGAGSCNSDLKNTYGEVKMEYGGKKVSTNMQFIGCIVGDYAKTAINTGIFTGKTIGACSMVYGYVTTNVASFVNYARLFGQVTEAPVDVMISTQQRMFRRRNVEQRECDVQLLRDMYELTRHERQLADEPLML